MSTGTVQRDRKQTQLQINTVILVVKVAVCTLCVCVFACIFSVYLCVCGRVIEGTSGEVSLLLSLISPSCSPSSVLPLSLRVVCLVYNIFLSLRAESESQHLRLAVIYANSVSLVKTDPDWRIGASTNR